MRKTGTGFTIPNLRTAESIANLIKKTPKRVFLIFGRAICAIHELMIYANCCCLGKMLKNFLDVHYNFFDI